MHGKGGWFHGRNPVLAVWEARQKASEGQEFILEKQVSRFSSAAQDVLHLLLLLQPPPLLAFPARVLPVLLVALSPALLVALSPPLGHNVTVSLLAAKLLAQEGEAGGCFPLPSLTVELPHWKTLASPVSHTSAHPLLR